MTEGKPVSILLVDQDTSMLGLVRAALASEGYEVFYLQKSEEALTRVIKHPPDLVIVEAVFSGMDGYTLTRNWRQNPSTSRLPILMLTSKAATADKVAGFEAGVDDYVTKPFEEQEFHYRVKNLITRNRAAAGIAPPPPKRGKIVTIFGTKGGVGKTTLAVNLALALRAKTHGRIALVDCDFFFGDLSLHLGLQPDTTMLDLVDRMDQLDAELMGKVLLTHSTGIRVLLAPTLPEQAERVTAMHIARILDCLIETYDFVLLDCHPSYDDRNLVLLEKAERILFVVRPELGPLRNMGAFFNLCVKLGIDLDKIHLVLNRAGSRSGIEVEQIERSFKSTVQFRMNSGGRAVVQSINRGIPLMQEKPSHPLSTQIAGVADFLVRAPRQSNHKA